MRAMYFLVKNNLPYPKKELLDKNQESESVCYGEEFMVYIQSYQKHTKLNRGSRMVQSKRS